MLALDVKRVVDAEDVVCHPLNSRLTTATLASRSYLNK